MIRKEDRVASFLGALLGLYLLSCGPAAMYFNYQTREQGFFPWLMFGEVVPTLKGLIWPYYALACRSHSGSSPPDAEHLDATEERRFSDILSTLTLRHPELDGQAVNDARSVLKAYQARTGSLLTKAAFQDQVGCTKFYLEWKAELSASFVISWDNQKIITTPRYDELTRNLLASVSNIDEVKTANGMLAAAATRQDWFRYEGQQIPMAKLREAMPEIEIHYKEMQSSFDRMVNALADMLR